ncbi:MAG: HAD-IIIC family phosphatase [Terriglobia bacterium]
MKLLEALEILKRPVRATAPVRIVHLECGFTPLHLNTFLRAHLYLCFPDSRIEMKTGLYGDLAGNLERLEIANGAVVCAVIEWADLDARLGVRALGGWRIADIADIVESARKQSERLIHALRRLAASAPVCVCMPTLPLPPLFSSRGAQLHRGACELREIAASLAVSLAASQRLRLANPQLLDELSPMRERFDLKSEIAAGFPYMLGHASALAELLAEIIRDAPSKKGLITDLDDTLWAGILGEVGVDGIAWDLDNHSHHHGIYQQFLASLASAGVLLGATSKNDPALVKRALSYHHMPLSADSLFPLEAQWGPKSEAVTRILAQWNIAADDVVFVDDTPMEVAEVQAAFPAMKCVIFPKNNYQALWKLLNQLRDWFGKSTVTADDSLRSGSIRAAAIVNDSLQTPGPGIDAFLRGVEASIVFSLGDGAQDHRAFELLNKTNQFNLNGKRLSESQWPEFFADPASFLLTASYEDKYGPLGKIAAMAGKADGPRLHVNVWVMSCRAFSRRIEHQMLKYLFEKMDAEEIIFDYQATPRNGPLQDLFAGLIGEPPVPGLVLWRSELAQRMPSLFHRVMEVTNG